MSHTYTSLLCHGVFSTKRRVNVLSADLLGELARIVGGIVRKRDGTLLAMGGTANHVHLLGSFHPKRAISDLFRDIKAVSSDWIHERFPDLRGFAWQEGYSAFSVSKSHAGNVAAYITRQQAHHRRRTFEEELAALLERHGVAYDPRYVFD